MTWIEPSPQRDPFEDLRQRVGDRGDLRRERVDVHATRTATLPRS